MVKVGTCSILMAKFFYILMVGFVLIGSPFLVCSLLSAEKKNIPKIYPFPSAEVEEVICRRLKNRGFKISRIPITTGQVQIEAMKGNESWRIILKPYSPLASQIQAEYTLNSKPDEGKREELLAYLTRYAEEPSSDIEDFYQVVPTPVLSQNDFVVCIKAEREKSPLQFSGFIVDREGLIMATAHDLEGIKETTIILFDGRHLKGRLIKTDLDRDLAIIEVKAQFDSFISLAKGRNLLGVGERVYSIGCPINLKGTIHSGIINGPPRLVNDLPLWQVNMQIFPGSSGSPVFDVQGNLVAIIKGRYRGTDSVGFLIPLETVIEFLREIPAGRT